MANPKQPKGLGKGLEAIFGDYNASVIDPSRGMGGFAVAGQVSKQPDETATASATPRQAPQRIAIEKIVPNAKQPRRSFSDEAIDELARSIREKGILQPLLLRPAPNRPGFYEIVAGERRWRASQRVPLHELPAIVKDLDDSTTLEIALIENIQRQDLNPIEEAEGYRRLIDEFSHTQEDIAKLVGKSRSHVANLLRLLDLPPYVRALLAEGTLTMGHARALANTPDPAKLADEVIEKGLSVRQTELLAQEAKNPSVAASPKAEVKLKPGKDADTMALERDLSATIGMAVTITDRNGQGTLTISYKNLDQLDEICARLTAQRM
ncbi:ParB/RepB/Spo0J family partition protein [Pedomonas mirosovicensis]|uniref:ParB/RepB/Spo0J family partition protein n=1 Tax=Pedomonas mirosovicensis TaxID=2908641 RepID=UPI002169F1E8|nr:ParB/RepB/Spo0J family partition protein [Pedomonas mirosovicensis]MCH8684114.1 ParB/RepB/Spo0J family partition protein [Pedomonas mirosovicensis]